MCRSAEPEDDAPVDQPIRAVGASTRAKAAVRTAFPPFPPVSSNVVVRAAVAKKAAVLKSSVEIDEDNSNDNFEVTLPSGDEIGECQQARA